MRRVDLSIVQNLAQTITTRYGSNASVVAAHAARQAHRNGDIDGAKQWARVQESIENLRDANSTGNRLDISA